MNIAAAGRARSNVAPPNFYGNTARDERALRRGAEPAIMATTSTASPGPTSFSRTCGIRRREPGMQDRPGWGTEPNEKACGRTRQKDRRPVNETTQPQLCVLAGRVARNRVKRASIAVDAVLTARCDQRTVRNDGRRWWQKKHPQVLRYPKDQLPSARSAGRVEEIPRSPRKARHRHGKSGRAKDGSEK